MDGFSTIFSLLVAGAGWYYMFYSRAAANLNGIEDEALNRRRHRLRRTGGVVMFLLAIALFAGFHSVDSATSAQGFVLVWLTVFLLLLSALLVTFSVFRGAFMLPRSSHRP